jgi:hypothetical protein
MNEEKSGPAPPLELGECRATSFRAKDAVDPDIANRSNRQWQDEVPDAPSRIVFGRRFAFIYIENCPLCGLEHMHGQFDLADPRCDPQQAYSARGGHRASHCSAQDVGNYAKCVRGVWRILPKPAPPEYHEPQGGAYRLVLGPKPACFTPLGIKSKRARAAMARLARSGAPVSTEILQPRRKKLVLNRGD